LGAAKDDKVKFPARCETASYPKIKTKRSAKILAPFNAKAATTYSSTSPAESPCGGRIELHSIQSQFLCRNNGGLRGQPCACRKSNSRILVM